MSEPIASPLPPVAPRPTPLDALHRRAGGRMVDFAGYSLPVQYPTGVLSEHRHCRTHAALFDVSHMGQASLLGTNAAEALERLVPGDIVGIAPGRQRYTMLLDEAGGILDDIIVANLGDRLLLVVNASRKLADFAHIAANLPEGVRLVPHEELALLALQGPEAVTSLAPLAPDAAALPFMGVGEMAVDGVPCRVSRSGYTGEDGFEIAVPAGAAEILAERLLAQPGVALAGLGARDSLRLEAGLCLYGSDIDEVTSPIEAGLAWTIGRRRRVLFDFPGGPAIRDQMAHGPTRLRVGLLVEDKAPARALTQIVAEDGTEAGRVTSGGFSPSLNVPIAMGYVRRDLAATGTCLGLIVRGRRLPARVVPLPFVPHRYATPLQGMAGAGENP